MIKAAAAAGPARRARRRARGADRHPPRRRRHRHHLPRQGRRQMAPVAQPKVRSPQGRRQPSRSTTPTSKLLNLMQGSFALAPRPFAHVAAARRDRARPRSCSASSACSTAASSARSRRSSTRARSATARCWSPPRSTPSTRTAPRKFINTHPGVTHNYLRNHDFNLWFTLATEPGSELGLQGTLDVMAEKTGARVDPPAADAEAVQDPHGPRDGEGHRGAGHRRRGGRAARARPDRALRRGRRGRSAPPRARCR